MKAAHQPEECARYIMHPLRGQPVYSAKTSPINFSRYFKTLFFPVWRIYSELPMILAYSLFFLFIITIFSAESIVAGVLLFLLASAILCGIITVVCYINIIIRYECDSMRKSSLNIDFYRDLVYIVSRGQRVIMDYDSIVVMREGADSVTVINNETGFVLTLSDTEQLEKIKDFLSLKTMMR